MTLENILQALQSVMKDEEVDSNLLEDSKARNYLSRYFVEREERPHIITKLTFSSIVKDYLELEIDEKNELNEFAFNFPRYFRMEKNSLRRRLQSEKLRKVVLEEVSAKIVVETFNKYLQTRKPKQIFGPGYITEHGGSSTYITCNKASEKGMEKIIKIATHKIPKINNYRTPEQLLKVDGPQKIIQIFEKFTKNRKKYEYFGSTYIRNNGGKKLYANCLHSLPKGIEEIIKIASKHKPEIKKYRTRKDIVKIDGIKDIIKIFGKYLKRREPFERFCGKSIQDNGGKALFSKCSRNISGGIIRLIEMAAKEDPRIKTYSSYEGILITDGPVEIIRFFEKFQEEKPNKGFGIGYILEKEGGVNLYARCRKHLDNNMNRIIALAAQEVPEILEHWSYRGKAS
jgi:adenylate kinase family enzyme